MEQIDVTNDESNDKIFEANSVDEKQPDKNEGNKGDVKDIEMENIGDYMSDSSEHDEDEAEIDLLRTMVRKNPYDYAAHIALINKLQRMEEHYALRSARENMTLTYPLTPELWLSWIRDEIKLAKNAEQKAEIAKLCERAVKDYLSVEVWLEYLQFSIGNMGMEKEAAKNIRQLFERALTAVGLHTIKGSIIWEAFREFEAVLYALIDPSNQAERKEQLDRIANLFRRQLACPLLDMEKTLEEYESWRAADGKEAVIDDDIVMGGYKRAYAKLNSRLPYEEKIVSSRKERELQDAYKACLLHEKQNGDPGSITVLYERAITDLSLEISIWLDYLNYLEEHLKIESVLEQVYYRATRNIPWCSQVWQKWIRSCEKWDRPVLDVQTLLENALDAGFSEPEDYRNLWIIYLEFLRRRFDRYSEKQQEQKQIEVLRETFNRACEHLAKSFGLDGDPNCVILQFWARTEAIHANNMEKARALWSDILSQGHSATASFWLEYISLERCYGDTKHLRKLYQKALISVKDWPESIANSWLDFERDEGTLEQMELCEAKTKEKLEKVAEERQKTQQTDSSSMQNKRTNKRKSDDGGKWKNLGAPSNKAVKTETKSKSNENHGTSERTAETDGNKSKVSPPPGFKSSENENRNADSSHEVDDKITVFVSNLDYTATEEEVRAALEPAGPITLFKMIKDYKGRSKGYCYVQLSSTEAVEKALKLDRTCIRNRPMFVSRCDPNKTTRSPVFKYNSTLEKNKLFVKGLPITTMKEDLVKLFEVYGALKDVRLVTYRNGHSKGLAYVDYEDESSAAKALLATDGMKIEDKVISVAISQPPERKKVQGEETPQIKSLGGSSTSRTTFGMPKTLLSMIPRSVKPSTSNGNASSSRNDVAQPMSNQDFRELFFS